MLAIFTEFAAEGFNGFDPDTAKLWEVLAEIASQREESLGIVADDVVEQRR